ncbi:hypothetical protein COCMIDRAFT_1692 [Bipolaris oryzae ATCC 44560]|uniref:Uncharacterized protein n=1 Tax=Bipolaris oryzae ATCC 44560 TaxID=930090 RepID=W6ZCB0_COCMI|nr:uncharacterized protein COCMIDRAFT_1692 [Bipolaris oryzae ATCC 44560]EUC49437.1 hypothetical protein COCMIDRAFT_1692 [Bipolaris oryzae ATCC 44560]
MRSWRGIYRTLKYLLNPLHTFIPSTTALNTTCPLVIRSAEFALADGALYVTEGVTPPPGNFIERFWQLNEEVRMNGGSPQFLSRILVLFDVKSKVSHKAGDQVYITTMSQRARVSFYICVCAANPGYVELIPNRFGGNECPANERGRDVAVNISRKSSLPPSAYGALSPCNSPYRMPIALLPEALQNICHCARGSGDYVNPWTRVRFTGWTPYLEHGNDGMMPREDSQYFASFLSIIEIWRCIRNANRRAKNAIPMHLGFIEHQPRLADFKLLVPSTGAHMYCPPPSIFAA